jgi:anti-sigma regulatory factor (Ser/Thr protein kinase)
VNDVSKAGETSPAAESWEASFPNSLPALMRTIESMSEFLRGQSAGPQALYRAQLGAEEIGTNIIKYAHDDQLEHRITLRVECHADRFSLQILDDGRPFDVREVPEPDPEQSLEERQPGGWGISLVRRLARRMDYERRDGMNVLTIEISRE